MKRIVEINDTLDERVDSAIHDVKNELSTYLDLNAPDRLPDLWNDLDYNGSIHEIVDSCVPVYHKEVEDLWYLHKNDFIEAYEDAGVGNNPMENNGTAAIYYYLQQEINSWYRDNAEEIFEDWSNKYWNSKDDE